MKWVMFYAIIFSINFFSYGQKTFIDSIKTASSYGSQAQLGEVFRKTGISFKNQGEYLKAEECYKESLNIFTSLGDSVGMGNVLNNLGLLFFTQSDDPKALAYYYQSVSLNEKIGNINCLAKNYLNLANFFVKQKDFEKALGYYYKSRAELEKVENKYVLGAIHMGIGNTFINKDYEYNDLEKAQEQYLSALSIYQEMKDSLNLSKLYVNLGVVYYGQEKYDDALNYYLKGLQINRELNSRKEILIACLNIGKVLDMKERYDESLIYFQEGKAVAEELRDAENYLHIIFNIVNVYMELGRVDTAATLFAEYNALRDSIYTEERSRQLTELQTAYETQKTAKELEQQKVATDQKAALNRKLFIVIISLFVLAVTVIVLFLQRQKALKHLRAKEDELHRQEVYRLQKDQDIQSLRAMMEGQEQERKRIAEDLHDRLGAKLSAIKLFHESSYTDTNKFEKVDEMLNETIIETREIAHNLAPSVLTKYGLVQALEDLLETLQSTNKIVVHFSHTNLQKRLPAGMETALYYIVQELVTNTLRHSEADMLSITLSCHEDGRLNLCYEDNGKGFDPATLSQESMGLRNMRTRLAPFSGQLSIDAAPNHGATFIIDIALDQT